ncbi:MAG: thioredoxin domain-containing protein [Bacillota bacterium]|jgi:uncharacterized protein YyaL (SSP411 family)
MDQQKTFTNRLKNEKSPYLLQHLDNPVDWYPWGEEAFTKAQAEDKPIFLSIGYSTCHWCHVMAHESFEDQEVADILNRDFISIKVDREERPDVDSVYMSACQAMTGSGGWPLTIIMTAQQKPFFAWTYLPKNSQAGMLGLTELLTAVAQKWQKDKEGLLKTGEQLTEILRKAPEFKQENVPSAAELAKKAVQTFKAGYDSQWGGFGKAPKFPAAHNLLFLLNYTEDATLLTMVEKTLEQMYKGGLFDHVGGGFCRYSTDEKWLVPHFEKMLYDNALLTLSYLKAYQITKRPLYRLVAERILAYILQELTDPAGGFYCGQDADSEGQEGKYYVFGEAELLEFFGPEANLFCSWFGITKSGNFEGQNIPNLIDNPNYDQDNPEISRLCQQLYDYRLQRMYLHKDDKVLTSWSSLMIIAFLEAYRVLENPAYLKTAQTAQQFLAANLFTENGRPLIRWKDGHTAHAGQLNDYTFYIWSLLEFYDATLETHYLEQASRLAQLLLELFFDQKEGGFYLYAHDAEQLISRPKEIYDNALPCGNSVALLILERLARLTGQEIWQTASHKQQQFMKAAASAYPAGHSFALLSLPAGDRATYELICTTAEKTIPPGLMKLLQEQTTADITVLLKTQENQQQLAKIAPFSASYQLPQQGTNYYLCRNQACFNPVSKLSELKKQLDS